MSYVLITVEETNNEVILLVYIAEVSANVLKNGSKVGIIISK